MIKKLLLVTALLVVFSGSSIFGADIFQLIPQEADFVLQLNINKVVSTPEAKKALMEKIDKSPEQKKAYDTFIKETGLDPMKDLSQIVVFSSGKVDPKSPVQMAGAILKGNFDIEKLVAAAKKDPKAAKNVEIKKIDGFQTFIPKNKKEGYGMFLDNTTVVVGAELAVMAVKDIKKGKGKSVSAKKAFFDILKKVDANATISGAGLIPAEMKEKIKANPQAAPLAALDYFFFSFNHGENIDFNFNAEVDKAENLEMVMTSLNGFLAMIKMFAGQVPEAADVLNMIKLSAKEKTVKINLNVPKAKLEEIKKRMEQKVKEMQKKGADEDTRE